MELWGQKKEKLGQEGWRGCDDNVGVGVWVVNVYDFERQFVKFLYGIELYQSFMRV